MTHDRLLQFDESLHRAELAQAAAPLPDALAEILGENFHDDALAVAQDALAQAQRAEKNHEQFLADAMEREAAWAESGADDHGDTSAVARRETLRHENLCKNSHAAQAEADRVEAGAARRKVAWLNAQSARCETIIVGLRTASAAKLAQAAAAVALTTMSERAAQTFWRERQSLNLSGALIAAA